MSEYPEHDKLQAIQHESQAAGDFIEWLGTQGIFLAEYEEGWERPMAVSTSLIKLLARWQDIDLNKIETEKRQMLTKIRQGA